MKIKLDAFNASILISSLLSFVVTLFYYGNFATGYHRMVILPILFLMVYFFILQNLRKRQFPFTIYGIIVMQWIRFVLMPPVCAIAGENAGVHYINPMTESLKLAILMMVYEMVVVSIFSMLWFSSASKKYIDKDNDERLLLQGNRFVYFTFALIVLVVIFTVGKNHRLINFIYIPLQNGRMGDTTETYLVLARQIIIIGCFLAFLWTVNYCKIKYKKNYKKIYVDIAIIVAMINVGIIIGERRTAQVYTALVCIWILLKSFPSHKKRIYISIGSMALMVLSLMSIYKFFAAFQHGSYINALSNSNADIDWFSRTLQSYFFGPENIAAVIDFANIYAGDIRDMLFDIFRSFFGISFLMKGKGIFTSELFNTYLYGTVTSSGHVISAIGYGYIYLGVLFSPFVAIFNIIISSKVELKMHTSETYEMTYIWGYVLVRFATNLFVNSPPLISYATITLGTGGLLFFTAIILKTKKRRKRLIITNQ